MCNVYTAVHALQYFQGEYKKVISVLVAFETVISKNGAKWAAVFGATLVHQKAIRWNFDNLTPLNGN